MHPRIRLLLLALLALLALGAVALFMTAGAKGSWSFVLPYRGAKLAPMLLVAYAVAVSTVLFQAITHNRILTPSVMGFDALYVLVQALVVFAVGLDTLRGGGNGALRFALETALMTGFACLLFRALFAGGKDGRSGGLHLVLLTGIVCGLLFRSLSGFVMRLVDPGEFAVAQERMLGALNPAASGAFWMALLLVALASLLAWRLRHRYDVLALGRETALNLGVDYRRTVLLTLVAVAVLVAVATALAGPMVFFGLLVSNLAVAVMGSERHRYVVPAALLWAVVFLVGGQALVQRVLALNMSPNIVIEFAGGLLFLLLVTRKKTP